MRSRLLDPDGLHRSNRIRAALTAIIGLVCLAAIIASLAAFAHSSSRWKDNPSQLVTVPDLAGSTPARVDGALDPLGLDLGSTRTAHDAVAPPGRILRTDPAAGTKVRPGTSVTLVVSSGPVMTKVPNVAGLTQDAAIRTLLAAHLQVGSTYTATSRFRSGLVAETRPGPSTNVQVTTAVDVGIATGLTAVPDVLNQSQATAVALVHAAGLGALLLEQSSSAAPPGTIVQIAPSPGSAIPVGTTITLTIALALPTPPPRPRHQRPRRQRP